MSEAPRVSSIVTVDEALAALSAIARDESAGADRMRALHLLMKTSTGEVVLPDPMTRGERIDRAARILRGLGVKDGRMAYLKAFPRRLSANSLSKHPMSSEELRIDTANLPRTLKQFYKRYPEAKRPGFPKGYPVGKGMLEQQAFIKEASVKIEVDRARARLVDTEMQLSEGPDDREEVTPQDQTPAD